MYRTSCPLRWSDLDVQWHVNNALFVDYLQEARVRFFRAYPDSGLLDSGVVVVNHQVEFLAAIDYSTHGVDIEISVSELGGARFELAYQIYQGDTLAARARTVLCPFDFATNRPARLQPVDHKFLASQLEPIEPLRELKAPALNGAGTPMPLYLRWSDLDSYGHVNNVKVYDYLQQARITATISWDPAMARAGIGELQYLWLVARQDVDYIAQLNHRVEPYEVRTAPISVGNTSVTLAAEIIDPATGQIFARGRTILVCAGLDGRPVSLPPSIREAATSRLVGA